jgi:transposase-like protein
MISLIFLAKVDSVSKEAFYIVLGVKKDMRREILGIYNQPKESSENWKDMFHDLKLVFDMNNSVDNKAAAYNRSKKFSQKWSKYYPHLNKFMNESEICYYFTYLDFDYQIRRMIYTTNWIERLNKDFKRTTNIRNSMPSVESVLTLLSKVAIDKNASTYNYPIYNLADNTIFK